MADKQRDEINNIDGNCKINIHNWRMKMDEDIETRKPWGWHQELYLKIVGHEAIQ